MTEGLVNQTVLGKLWLWYTCWWLNTLNLEKSCTSWFSMGGGEIARYIGKYGTEKLLNCFVSSVTPYMQNRW
jgi:hypothetical protein